MAKVRNFVEEIFNEIKKRNSEVNSKSIPDSDQFIKFSSVTLGIPVNQTVQAIKVLIAAHKIFRFEIVGEDTIRNIPTIEGYVVADLNLIRNMKNFFQNELVFMYNSQFHKNMMIHQVLKDIFPIIKSLNNTPIGQLANKAMMLQELEKLMERNYNEYTEEYQEKHYEIEMRKANLNAELKKPVHKDAAVISEQPRSRSNGTPVKSGAPGSARAVDGKKYQDFISKSKKYPLQRILNIYGLQFFLQVNIRNYQFTYLKQLIEDHQIKKRSDLLLIRDMVKKTKENARNDHSLGSHMTAINELERIISHYLYFSEAPKKEPAAGR